MKKDSFEEYIRQSERPIVLLIDEVDTATNNQVFLDFLAQLRAEYLDRDIVPTFQSCQGIFSHERLTNADRKNYNSAGLFWK